MPALISAAPASSVSQRSARERGRPRAAAGSAARCRAGRPRSTGFSPRIALGERLDLGLAARRRSATVSASVAASFGAAHPPDPAELAARRRGRPPASAGPRRTPGRSRRPSASASSIASSARSGGMLPARTRSPRRSAIAFSVSSARAAPRRAGEPQDALHEPLLDVTVERPQQEDAALAAQRLEALERARRRAPRCAVAARERLQRDAAPRSARRPRARAGSRRRAARRARPPAGRRVRRAARRPGAAAWAAPGASPGRPRARSPQLGELLVERPRRGRALFERDHAGRTRWARAASSSGEAEAGDDRRDAALGERGQHGQRAAAAHERGRRAGGAFDRAPRRLQGGQRRVERARLGAVGAEAAARRPPAGASRSSCSRLRGDLVGALAADDPHGQVGAGRRDDDRARLAALDLVDVERRLGRGADVELGRGAGVGRAGADAGELGLAASGAWPTTRSPPATGGMTPARSGSGSLPSGPARTPLSARCSAWKAFSAAPPYMPECAVWVPVRTSTWANTIPRVASVSAGVSASTMPLSKTITQSAPRASWRTHSPTSSEPVSSAPSISTRTWTGSSPLVAIAQAVCSSG